MKCVQGCGARLNCKQMTEIYKESTPNYKRSKRNSISDLRVDFVMEGKKNSRTFCKVTNIIQIKRQNLTMDDELDKSIY